MKNEALFTKTNIDEMEDMLEEVDKKQNDYEFREEEEMEEIDEMESDPIRNIPILNTLNKESQVSQEEPYFNEIEGIFNNKNKTEKPADKDRSLFQNS